MITLQDLYNIVGNKIANETGKAIIRNSFPPQIAERMCAAIDGQERAEHFQRLLVEYTSGCLISSGNRRRYRSF